MAEVVYALSLLAAALFVLAGVIKLRHPVIFLEELEDYQVFPRSVLLPLAGLVPVVEIVAGVLTAVPATYRVGSALLIGLLVLFTGVVAAGIIRGLTAIRCACLGRFSRQLGWAIPLRNALLAAPLIGALVLPADEPSGASFAGAVLLWILGWLVVEVCTTSLSIREARS